MSIKANVVSDLLKASYKRNKEAESIGKQSGYTLDHQLSNAEAKIFLKDNKPTVVFTGSRKVGDWITNAYVAAGIGGFTKRFADSRNLINDVKKKYNSEAITTLGHSLGGKLAEYTGDNSKAVKKVVTVNKAAGYYDRFKKIKDKQTDIRSTTDLPSLLSIGQRTKNKITLKQTAYLDPFKAHDINTLSKLKNKFI